MGLVGLGWDGMGWVRLGWAKYRLIRMFIS